MKEGVLVYTVKGVLIFFFGPLPSAESRGQKMKGYEEVGGEGGGRKTCMDKVYRWIILFFIMWLTFGTPLLLCSSAPPPPKLFLGSLYSL